MLFWMRAMPRDMVGDLFLKFDARQRSVFEKLVGGILTDGQWEVAQLPIRLGGCGVRGAVMGADAAHVMSRAMTREACSTLDRVFIGEGEVEGVAACGLGTAVQRLNGQLLEVQAIGEAGTCTYEQVDQKRLLLNKWVEEEASKTIVGDAIASELNLRG